MRKTEREITDRKQIDRILTNGRIVRVAIFDEEYPYIVPLNYGFKDNALYIHCAREGKKLDLLSKNNKVCFEVEDSCKIMEDETSCNWTTKYRSVIGYGEVSIITGFEEKIYGMDIIMEHHGKKENSYFPELLNRMVLLKISISRITGKQSL